MSTSTEVDLDDVIPTITEIDDTITFSVNDLPESRKCRGLSLLAKDFFLIFENFLKNLPAPTQVAKTWHWFHNYAYDYC